MTLSPTLAKMPPDDIAKIRTLLKTGEIPAHPLSAHPRVPPAVRLAVQKAVLTISATPEGAKLLGNIRLPSPIEADYARDYRALEGVDVKILSEWGK